MKHQKSPQTPKSQGFKPGERGSQAFKQFFEMIQSPLKWARNCAVAGRAMGSCSSFCTKTIVSKYSHFSKAQMTSVEEGSCNGHS
ncbi:hypothetical protein NPIL_100891 [Nephila pilipes]|uniref:Uncharacterized protein n=1 Tax=Nephila pilipes TaxID=299642 RepID=A0A8X6TH10_NEPPI|nr:hypothetical protein NPIL_100891 [Nephila pilipes]